MKANKMFMTIIFRCNESKAKAGASSLSDLHLFGILLLAVATQAAAF